MEDWGFEAVLTAVKPAIIRPMPSAPCRGHTTIVLPVGVEAFVDGDAGADELRTLHGAVLVGWLGSQVVTSFSSVSSNLPAAVITS